MQYRARDAAKVPDIELLRSQVTLDLGKRVVGISIAPDSAYASCDLWIGGDEQDARRVAISVGNPWLGWLEDFGSIVRVSLPVCAPAITPSATANIGWDTSIETAQNRDEDEFTLFGFPLRLEVWYAAGGELVETLPRVSERSELVAHGVTEFLAGIVESCDLYVCTHGRRRIDVHVYSPDEDVDVTITAIEGMKRVDPDGAVDVAAELVLELDDVGTTTATVTDYDVFSFEGNPITVLKVNVVPTGEIGSAFQAQVKVIAQDY